MGTIGDYKMRQQEEAEAAIGRAVDEAAMAEHYETVDNATIDRESEAYYEWQEKIDTGLYESFAKAVQDLRDRGWSREELDLAFEDVVDR